VQIRDRNKKTVVSIRLLAPRNISSSSSGINSSLRRHGVYDRDRFMNVSRLIEFFVSVLVAFLVLATVAFFSVRPTLKDIRSEVQANWKDFLLEMRNRNELLPGLMESIRGFDSGHARLSEKMFQARSIANRSSDPDTIVSASNEIEELLQKIEKLAVANPDLSRYSPFVAQWDQMARASRRVAFARLAYNSSSRLYNQLLATFPQNLLTSIAGFPSVNTYPAVRPVGEN
jgi:LemA protein